jgi:hypothetical protein
MGYSVETVDVKSKGKLLGSVNVEVFEDVASAIEFFDSKYASDEDINGEAYVCDLVNQTHRNNVANSERNKLTRTTAPMTQLKRKAAADPAAKAKLDALMKELGILEDEDEDED